MITAYTPMSFGKWLFHHREGARLSGGDLERLSGVSRQYISNLERELVQEKSQKPIQPSLEIVESLAKALRVNLNEARMLAGHAPANVPTFLKINAVINSFESLTPERQDLAVRQFLALIHSLLDDQIGESNVEPTDGARIALVRDLGELTDETKTRVKKKVNKK